MKVFAVLLVWCDAIEEEEGVLGRGAEVVTRHCAHDVGVTIQELHELLQTPETAFADTQRCLDQLVILMILS